MGEYDVQPAEFLDLITDLTCPFLDIVERLGPVGVQRIDRIAVGEPLRGQRMSPGPQVREARTLERTGVRLDEAIIDTQRRAVGMPFEGEQGGVVRALLRARPHGRETVLGENRSKRDGLFPSDVGERQVGSRGESVLLVVAGLAMADEDEAVLRHLHEEIIPRVAVRYGQGMEADFKDPTWEYDADGKIISSVVTTDRGLWRGVFLRMGVSESMRKRLEIAARTGRLPKDAELDEHGVRVRVVVPKLPDRNPMREPGVAEALSALMKSVS